MKPVVGILCCGFDGKNQFVTDTYVRAVRISGGIPLLIPILPQDFPINSYLDICDGFLLPGGGDFTPFLFNEDPLPGVGQTNLSVDLFQIHFAEEILKRHLPVIGICRGYAGAQRRLWRKYLPGSFLSARRSFSAYADLTEPQRYVAPDFHRQRQPSS